jgi:hypothetical protein
LFRFITFYFNEHINERSLGYGESGPWEYSRLLMCEKAGLELGLALAAGPLGNLAAEKADQPKELAWRAGKDCLKRENLKIYFRSFWGPWFEGSLRSYRTCQNTNLFRYKLLLYELSSYTQ